MPKSISGIMFSFDPNNNDGGTPAYFSISAKDLKLNESWFRDSISNNPDLVILPCEKADLTDEQWYHWDTEFQVKTPKDRPVGKVDVLLISESGRIGLVETKLAYNPERRRNVLAQILDYSVHLTEMSPKLLPALPKDENGDQLVGYDEMTQHLSEGDFLLIVAGDELDERAVRLSETLLGDHQINPWDLAMIDLAIYQKEDSVNETNFLIIPTLRHSYISIPRHIVRVIVEGESPKAIVDIERYSARTTNSRKQQNKRQSWNADKFFSKLDELKCPPNWKRFGERLHKLPEQFPDLSISFGTGKKGSLTVKRNGNGIIEFYTRDIIRFRRTRFKLALGAELGKLYDDELINLFSNQMPNNNYPAVEQKYVLPKIDSLFELILSTLKKASENESD